MGLIETASGNSVWRGMDYYENKKVVSWKRLNDDIYEGVVSGSEGNAYNVHIETLHPRKSVCTCPFAEGRRVVCKHMIALYFTAEPKVAKDFLKQVEEWEKEEEEQERQHYIELREYVDSLTKVELQEQLYNALIELEDVRNRYMPETEQQRKERNRQEDLQRLRGFRPMDDDFMRCIFRDDIPLAQHVLRILTGKEDLEIVDIKTQADMKRLVGARSLCLDAYGTDSTGKRYDLEIQRADKGAGARRARYHSSAMDADILDAGEDFEALNDTYTIL